MGEYLDDTRQVQALVADTLGRITLQRCSVEGCRQRAEYNLRKVACPVHTWVLMDPVRPTE